MNNKLYIDLDFCFKFGYFTIKIKFSNFYSFSSFINKFFIYVSSRKRKRLTKTGYDKEWKNVRRTIKEVIH